LRSCKRQRSKRTRDLDDIHLLLRKNRQTLNMSEIDEYFTVFDRRPLLDELLSNSKQP